MCRILSGFPKEDSPEKVYLKDTNSCFMSDLMRQINPLGNVAILLYLPSLGAKSPLRVMNRAFSAEVASKNPAILFKSFISLLEPTSIASVPRIGQLSQKIMALLATLHLSVIDLSSSISTFARRTSDQRESWGFKTSWTRSVFERDFLNIRW